MASQPQWSVGDRTINPARPDWGVGTITSVAAHFANGKEGQRLGIRFDGAGLKTVSTAIITLTAPSSGVGETPIADLTALPEGVLDGSRPLVARLGEAAKWYRFREGDRSALDWAIQRLGVSDPLSTLTREQLHAAREGFFRGLDHQIRQLARELGRRDPAALAAASDSAPPAARLFLQPHTGR